jgi:vancomycin permeability regulator SanA
MKKLNHTLLTGDILAILTFLFFSYLLNTPNVHLTLLNLAVMAGVVSAVWILLSKALDAAHFRMGFWYTARRTFLSWILAAPIIGLARHLLVTLTHPAYSVWDISFFAIVFLFLGAGIFLAFWRTGWWLGWRVLQLPRKAFIRRLSIGSAILFGSLILASGVLRLALILRYRSQILPETTVPSAPAALVFGAGVWRSGAPSRVLVDRVKAGVRLYNLGKVDFLLMSGGGQEPEVMRDLAVAAGIPANAILMDAEGLDTRTSCIRARENFAFDRLILVTQRFHLPRALYLCQDAGLEAQGVAADLPGYTPNGWVAMQLREFPAVAKAFLEVLGAH